MLSNGGVNQDLANQLLGGGGGSGGGGGGGADINGNASASPGSDTSYLSVYNQLAGANGGFDPRRLGAIDDAANKLGNTSGNYGVLDEATKGLMNAKGNFGATEKSVKELQDMKNQYGATDTSISGLQNFAKSGGVSQENIDKIDNPTLEEFSRTGGFSDQNLADIRARSNSSVPTFYQSLRDNLNRNKLVNNNMGPGFSEAGFRLARQSAQDAAATKQATEADLASKVQAGRLSASSTLSDRMLGLSQLQSQNTLTGYTNAGTMDIAKQKQIGDALAQAGTLDTNEQKAILDALAAGGTLDAVKQKQVNDALAQSGSLNLGTQTAINNSRLAATGGLQQDALTRMQDATQNRGISASSGAASAALNAANQRFLIQQEQEGKQYGATGLLNTYKSSPGELMDTQDLLYRYNMGQGAFNQQNVGNTLAGGNIPGITGNLNSAGQMVGGGAGILNSLMNSNNRGAANGPLPGSTNPNAQGGSVDLNRLYNTVSRNGQNTFNDANQGRGVGNFDNTYPGVNPDYSGINPNTGLWDPNYGNFGAGENRQPMDTSNYNFPGIPLDPSQWGPTDNSSSGGNTFNTWYDPNASQWYSGMDEDF
jgi:hypothetical protein